MGSSIYNFNFFDKYTSLKERVTSTSEFYSNTIIIVILALVNIIGKYLIYRNLYYSVVVSRPICYFCTRIIGAEKNIPFIKIRLLI